MIKLPTVGQANSDEPYTVAISTNTKHQQIEEYPKTKRNSTFVRWVTGQLLPEPEEEIAVRLLILFDNMQLAIKNIRFTSLGFDLDSSIAIPKETSVAFKRMKENLIQFTTLPFDISYEPTARA